MLCYAMPCYRSQTLFQDANVIFCVRLQYDPFVPRRQKGEPTGSTASFTHLKLLKSRDLGAILVRYRRNANIHESSLGL
jgi:hypothetical protein